MTAAETQDTGEEFDGCAWQVGGNYPDSPPELCELDRVPDSEYCARHTAAEKAMEEWEERFPPDMETV